MATERFFFKGTNGRWCDVLNDDDVAFYEMSAATLDPELRRGLEAGRHSVALTWRILP